MAFMVENRRELCTGPFIAGAQRQSNASKNGILLMIVILSAWLRVNACEWFAAIIYR